MTASSEASPAASTRVLFVRMGGFSGTNAELLAALRRVRPDVEFEEVDVGTLFGGGIAFRARFGLAAVWEYGVRTLRSRRRLRDRTLRTSAFFAAVRRKLKAWVADRRYAFSLQTQSLFDAATGACPHYVYTDHAALVRRVDGAADSVERPDPRWLEREGAIYRNAAHVFTFGSSVRRVLIDRYGTPEAKVSRIGAGASVTFTAPPPTDLARYARRNVLFVGVDWRRKGGPDLLAAFALLRERFPDATLTIVGCAPPEARGVEGCTALGKLAAADVAARYRAASCFCMPSRLEPFGLVYLEAAHFALPIVATTVGDTADMVLDEVNGLRVPPADPAALAEALARVLADPVTAQRMGAAGAGMAHEWTWDAVAAQILERALRPDPA